MRGTDREKTCGQPKCTIFSSSRNACYPPFVEKVISNNVKSPTKSYIGKLPTKSTKSYIGKLYMKPSNGK